MRFYTQQHGGYRGGSDRGDRALQDRHGAGCGVHLHLVLDCRLVQPGRDPFRAGPRAIHESDPRRKG